LINDTLLLLFILNISTSHDKYASFQGFQFDFYVRTPDSQPQHVGYSYLLPMEMKNSNDIKNLPITGLKHKPIGQIKGKINKI